MHECSTPTYCTLECEQPTKLISQNSRCKTFATLIAWCPTFISQNTRQSEIPTIVGIVAMHHSSLYSQLRNKHSHNHETIPYKYASHLNPNLQSAFIPYLTLTTPFLHFKPFTRHPLSFNDPVWVSLLQVECLLLFFKNRTNLGKYKAKIQNQNRTLVPKSLHCNNSWHTNLLLFLGKLPRILWVGTQMWETGDKR